MPLECCNKPFMALYRVELPFYNKLSRVLEFGYCKCGTAVSLLTEQDVNYDITRVRQSGIKAERELDKALPYFDKKLGSKSIQQGSKGKENWWYGTTKRSNKKDSLGNPIYLQVRKNENGKKEIIKTSEVRYLNAG